MKGRPIRTAVRESALSVQLSAYDDEDVERF